MSKRIGYVRVSTAEQNPDRQLEKIELDKKFIEYASGTTTKRPVLQQMLEYVREDDIIIAHSMDRLCRNIKDLRNLVDELTKKGIQVHFHKENLIFNGDQTPIANLMLMLLGSIAEFEHALIRERQLEGIAIAKAKGKYKGKKSALDKEKIEQIKQQMQTRKTKSRIARELNISRPSLYKYLKYIEKKEKNGLD